jgi:hypothetical protein
MPIRAWPGLGKDFLLARGRFDTPVRASVLALLGAPHEAPGTPFLLSFAQFQASTWRTSACGWLTAVADTQP